MKRGFYAVMAAQFFSSLADSALLAAVLVLLQMDGAPKWEQAALVPMFGVFYVVLAPFVGAFADAGPKGRVMFNANFIKVSGCLLMLFGANPLICYAIVGLGAAAYSPAKYGILTEMLPPSLLVKANGWIEGLTIASIVLGTLLGGQLLRPSVAKHLLQLDLPYVDLGICNPPEAAIAVLLMFYLLAALFNLRVPATGVEYRPMPKRILGLVPDFWACNLRLWGDKLGQISLGATTLFWGVSANLRLIVLGWAAAALGYDVPHATALVGVVIIGTAAGIVLAAFKSRLEDAPRMLPLGIGMGLLVLLLNWITNVWVAAPFLILLGALGGYLVVPMNALLQHRGHNLMGAGRSIAVQNFNEQACIVVLGAMNALAAGAGMSVFFAIGLFGVLNAGIMWLIKWRHSSNCMRHADEVAHLLQLARGDKAHG
jgi:MFS family permease